jgi:putative transposase
VEQANVLERARAVRRYHSGESPAAICQSMGYSRDWLYKWVARFDPTDPTWAAERSRRPATSPRRTDDETERAVLTLRHALVSERLFCGAQAIQWELARLPATPVPSVRTINRILRRAGVDLQRRTDRYVPKGKRYPALTAATPSAVHQSDFVGPCYLQGPVRFFSLHSVDIATGRCAVQPLAHRDAQSTIDGFWASWCRLGLPRHQQVDNDAAFYGSERHPRGMGPLIRLCLELGIEAWFIPTGEPWRNGVVEHFNGCWETHGPLQQPLVGPEALASASLRFEARHNARHRYTKLRGQTPNAALATSGTPLRFPADDTPPRHPLSKPERGRYHLIRFIRHDGGLNVFGERFPVPPEAHHEYVRATVDVARQRLLVSLEDQVIDEHVYRLR